MSQRTRLQVQLVLRGCACALLCLVACSSPKSAKQVDGHRDGGGAAGKDSGAQPLPLPLPGGYEPSVACGDLGKACSVASPCAGELSCSASLCLPDPEAKGVVPCADGCPGEAPICAQSTCISVDQLACICAQPAGRASLGLCAGLRDDGPKQGLVENSVCSASADACGGELSCLAGEDEGATTLGICKQACDKDVDCDTACCTVESGIAGLHCAPRKLCVGACVALDQVCDGQRSICCEGLVCSGAPPDASVIDPVLIGCKKPCSENTDCESGCCVLFVGRDDGICAPEARCK